MIFSFRLESFLYFCGAKSQRMVPYLKDRKLRVQFEELFKLHFNALCFYAMSFVKDREVARDTVHDVFMAVWDRRAYIDFEKSVYPYLVSLTRNRCINYLEHLKVEGKHISRQLAFGNLYDTMDDCGYEELLARIMKRVDELPDRCREVMYLCFVECRKHKEIADMLNISITTVRSHVATGLKALRRDFPDYNLLLLLAFYRPNVKK